MDSLVNALLDFASGLRSVEAVVGALMDEFRPVKGVEVALAFSRSDRALSLRRP